MNQTFYVMWSLQGLEVNSRTMRISGYQQHHVMPHHLTTYGFLHLKLLEAGKYSTSTWILSLVAAPTTDQAVRDQPSNHPTNQLHCGIARWTPYEEWKFAAIYLLKIILLQLTKNGDNFSYVTSHHQFPVSSQLLIAFKWRMNGNLFAYWENQTSVHAKEMELILINKLYWKEEIRQNLK